MPTCYHNCSCKLPSYKISHWNTVATAGRSYRKAKVRLPPPPPQLPSRKSVVWSSWNCPFSCQRHPSHKTNRGGSESQPFLPTLAINSRAFNDGFWWTRRPHEHHRVETATGAGLILCLSLPTWQNQKPSSLEARCLNITYQGRSPRKQVCVPSSLGGGSQDSKVWLVNPCPLTHWSHLKIRQLQQLTPQVWAQKRKGCCNWAGAQQAAETDGCLQAHLAHHKVTQNWDPHPQQNWNPTADQILHLCQYIYRHYW